MRPPSGVREKSGLQASGAGHERNLEIEDVLDKKNTKEQDRYRPVSRLLLEQGVNFIYKFWHFKCQKGC